MHLLYLQGFVVFLFILITVVSCLELHVLR